MHLKLILKFIALFDRLLRDQKMQLIFTTHESSIMDQELLRRDEIWFVERDKNNSSHVYSLDKLKKDTIRNSVKLIWKAAMALYLYLLRLAFRRNSHGTYTFLY